ncbi:MAG: FkbM family methyltransferase [Calothrix sp. SM1_7_51]|nr:FkbM family methyltransferase [Calothrix sp. SM1_7_51]
MAKLWRRGTIYAFEPVPEIYEQLTKATKGFKNVFCNPLALSDQVGTSEIFVSSGSSDASSSLLAPKDHLIEHPSVNFSNNIQIQTTTLDQWALENKVNYVDFMWLDMQGYEPFALKASPRILSTVKAIYTEVSLKQLYDGTPLYLEFRQWLEEQGFRVEREELAWSDAKELFFVRERSTNKCLSRL